MIDLVAAEGYEKVTIRNLTRLAGVSSHTFYEHFDGKEECFLATYETIERYLLDRVREAQEGKEDWEERLRLGFLALAREIIGEADAARLALIEAFAGGPAALERIRRARSSFESILAENFARAPDHVTVPPFVLKGIVAGVSRVARARLLASEESEMLSLAEQLLRWTLALRAESADLQGLDRRLPSGSTGSSSIASRAAELVEDIQEGDRALIIDSVARLAASEGYWHLSVPRIRAAAGITRKTFDTHFEGVEDSFLTTVETLTGRAVAKAMREGWQAETWAGGVYRTIAALCADLARNRPFARLAFIEVFAPGPEGMVRREALVNQIVKLLRDAAPPGQAPSELEAEASVGAIWGVMHHHVAGGEAERLPQVAGTLAFLALAPSLGSAPAIEEIAAEQGRIADSILS